MNYFEIDKCRVCKSSELTTVFDLKDMYLTGVFPKAEEKDPIKAPLKLVKCDSENGCGLVQLKHSVNPDLMYGDTYGYRSGINQTMSDHLKGIVDEIKIKCNNILPNIDKI